MSKTLSSPSHNVLNSPSYVTKIKAKTLDYQMKRPRVKKFDPNNSTPIEQRPLTKKAKIRRDEIITLINLQQKDPNAIGKCGCIRSKCFINGMCFDHWKEKLEESN